MDTKIDYKGKFRFHIDDDKTAILNKMVKEKERIFRNYIDANIDKLNDKNMLRNMYKHINTTYFAGVKSDEFQL